MSLVSQRSSAQRLVRWRDGGVALLCLPLLTACPTAFIPGSLIAGKPVPMGRERQLSCLELSVRFTGDVLRVDFGNRCRYPIQVDFRRLGVRTSCDLLPSCPARPFDPRSELSLATLDGRDHGWEKIRYPAVKNASWWCIDVAGLTPTEPPSPGSSPPPEICSPPRTEQRQTPDPSSGPASPQAEAQP